MAVGNFRRGVDPILKEGKWTEVEENNLEWSSVGLCVLGQLQPSFLQAPLLFWELMRRGSQAIAFPLKVLPLEILSASLL